MTLVEFLIANQGWLREELAGLPDGKPTEERFNGIASSWPAVHEVTKNWNTFQQTWSRNLPALDALHQADNRLETLEAEIRGATQSLD